MDEYIIDSKEAFDDFKEYLAEIPRTNLAVTDDSIIINNEESFEIVPKYRRILKKLKKELEDERNRSDDSCGDNPSGDSCNVSVDVEQIATDVPEENPNTNLIFGKDKTERVVSVEVDNSSGELVIFQNDGSEIRKPNKYWILGSRSLGKTSELLEGELSYRYIREFNTHKEFKKASGILYGKKVDTYSIYDPAEAAMIKNGITPFKGMKVDEIDILSFDIETTGIAHNKDSNVLMISNTFRNREGEIERRLFDVLDYEDCGEMIHEWTKFVREKNPSVMLGHNIFGFDLPYLSFMYRQFYDGDMDLGRDDSTIKYGKKPKKFRKDGSQTYDYFDAKIFGRQVIDTFFLAIKSDIGRKYPNYGLKSIIEFEGLEKEDRIKWDFDENNPREIFKLAAEGKDLEI